MFFYLPFFTFAAAMLLAFPDLIPWLAYIYLTALILPRIWGR
jgi:hypothetical protein